jgi:hypothetical protein
VKKRWVGSKPVEVRPMKRRNSEGGEGFDMMIWFGVELAEMKGLSSEFSVCHLPLEILGCPLYIFHP